MKNLLPIVLSAVALGCGADAAPVAGVSVRLSIDDDPGDGFDAPEASDAQGTRFTFRRASASVRHIELDLESGTSCADLEGFAFDAPVSCDQDKVRIDGPFVVDLNDGTANPSLAGVTVPELTYERVDVRFDDTRLDEALVSRDDPLYEHTLHVLGDFDLDGTRNAAELRLAFHEDARFERPGGVTIGAGAAKGILLWLDAGRWLAGLPITDCIASGDLQVRDGTLTMDDARNECSDIENELKDAIRRSGQLGGR